MVSMQTDLRLGERIRRVAVLRHEVDSERVRPRGDEKRHRHNHGGRGVVQVSHGARQRRDDGAAKDTRHDEPGAALGVAAQPAHAEGHDGREADGLEEEGDVEHRHARVLALGDGGPDEDDTHGQEDAEDDSGLDEVHKSNAHETADGEGALGTGEELRAEGGIGVGAGLGHVVDEVTEVICQRISNIADCHGSHVPRDGDLGSSVAELSEGSVEETVLLDEGFVAVVGGARLLCLECHVCIGDLGDVRDEEDEGEDENEDRDREVDPLHVLQRLHVVEVEEDVGAQDGGHDRADAIEGLGDVDSNFGVLGRAADCSESRSAHLAHADRSWWWDYRDNVEPTGDVRVGSCLERTQAVADDEDADAEAGEGAVQDGRDGQQGAKSVEEEAPDEDGSIAVVPQDPGGVPKRSQGVGADGFTYCQWGLMTGAYTGRQECGGGGELARTQSRRPGDRRIEPC